MKKINRILLAALWQFLKESQEYFIFGLSPALFILVNTGLQKLPVYQEAETLTWVCLTYYLFFRMSQVRNQEYKAGTLKGADMVFEVLVEEKIIEPTKKKFSQHFKEQQAKKDKKADQPEGLDKAKMEIVEAMRSNINQN